MEKKKKLNKKFLAIIIVLGVAAIVIGISVYIHSQHHEKTDDAQVKANMTAIIPHVGGYIEKVYVSDNQMVHAGDTLFTIDSRDYQIKLEEARAQVAAAESQQIVSQTSIGSYQQNVAASNAQADAAKGNVETAKIKLWRAEQDFERYKNLYEDHSITEQQYEQALATKKEATEQLSIYQNQEKAMGSQRNAAQSQKDISQKQVAVADAKIKSAEAMLDAAQLNIDYTYVVAPISGQLSNVDMQQGQYVQPGQALFYLVNLSEKWIVANFKETQLSKMRIGQKVEIDVDAFPDMKLEGIIEAFSPATGARFSLLPPDNATGNFVKTVQRLPVKIQFTEENDSTKIAQLLSGMNVEIDVHIK